MKREAIFYTILYSVLIFSQFASAELFIALPSSSTYNLGDSLNVNVTLTSSIKQSDFLKVDLMCADKPIEVYRSIHSLQIDEQKVVNIDIGIEPQIIGDLRGSCTVLANYGQDKISSRTFEISSEIDVDFDVEGVAFGPSETVKISGTAIKSNNEPVDGFVIVSIEGMNLTTNEIVKFGKFNISFVLADNSPPGSYVIKSRVYEKESDSVLNEGESSNVIKLKMILKELKLSLDSQSVVPGNDFTYTIHLKDQSGAEVADDVEVVIIKPDKTPFQKSLLKSGVKNKIYIPLKHNPA